MNTQNTAQHKKALEQEKAELIKKIQAHETPTDFGNEVDEEEEKNEDEEFSNTIALAKAYRDRVAEIQDALDKIDNERFGRCENCENEIGDEALQKNPAQKNCHTCIK